jgi:hypothetical protein
MYDNVKRGNDYLADLTENLPDWASTTRGIGGYWSAGGTFRTKHPDVLRDIFLTSLFNRVVEGVGNDVTWEGFIAEMTYTHNGLTYVRSVFPMANYWRTIYQYIGDNLFSNGSAESGEWTQVGTPSTHEVSTDWFARGSQSMHVVTDAADEGTQIQTGITVTAGRSYIVRVSTSIVSGEWTLAVHQTTDDSVLASRTSVAGANEDEVLMCQIPDSHQYSDTVYVNITADDASREAYFDAAVFQLAPFRKETKWYYDADSAGEFGRIERILVEAGRTDAAAAGLAQDGKARQAWPRTRPPERFSTFKIEENVPDTLDILCLGYVHTLSWLHAVSTGGTDDFDHHISNLIGESEFITAARIRENTAQDQVEERNPVTLWDAIEDITLAGDGAGGTPWMCGVYADRLFYYNERPTDPEYQFVGGRLVGLDGSPVAPWHARPNLCIMSEMPTEPVATGVTEDDPSVVWISEVEYLAPDGLNIVRESLRE